MSQHEPANEPSQRERRSNGEGDPFVVLRVQYAEAKAAMLAACVSDPARRWTGRELQALYPTNLTVASAAFFSLCNPERDGRLILDNDLLAHLRAAGETP